MDPPNIDVEPVIDDPETLGIMLIAPVALLVAPIAYAQNAIRKRSQDIKLRAMVSAMAWYGFSPALGWLASVFLRTQMSALAVVRPGPPMQQWRRLSPRSTERGRANNRCRRMRVDGIKQSPPPARPADSRRRCNRSIIPLGLGVELECTIARLRECPYCFRILIH